MEAAGYKRIVVLANSVKRSHWCVAGKEIFASQGGWTPGLWVRPTDPANEGAITLQTMRGEDGRVPAVLDIVDVPILKYMGDNHHPEDWIVDTARRWRRQGTFPFAKVENLCDAPPHLWAMRTDAHKVREGFVAKMLRPATLYFIKPEESIQVSIFKETSSDHQAKLRRVLRLRHRGTDHEFAITDPRFEDCYLGGQRVFSERPLELTLPQTGRLYLCLSLTPPFHGAHYKIAATVWENPPA